MLPLVLNFLEIVPESKPVLYGCAHRNCIIHTAAPTMVQC